MKNVLVLARLRAPRHVLLQIVAVVGLTLALGVQSSHAWTVEATDPFSLLTAGQTADIVDYPMPEHVGVAVSVTQRSVSVEKDVGGSWVIIGEVSANETEIFGTALR